LDLPRLTAEDLALIAEARTAYMYHQHHLPRPLSDYSMHARRSSTDTEPKAEKLSATA